MEIFITLCGFIGSWLLVAGPLYQAALELGDEDIEFDRIRSVGKTVAPPPHPSAWWWLIPPIKFHLEQKRDREYRTQYLKALESKDAEALVSFMNKARAWLYVATGGLLIAIKETFELTSQINLGLAWFWAIVAAMAIASILNTVLRITRNPTKRHANQA